jgi:tRNA-Thr(GGU) m(6)t(6)A37 methyltransferase TsaA
MAHEFEPVTLTPVGVVRSPRTEVRDDDWGGVVATIELDPARFAPEALAGLDAFSHAEVLFFMNRVDESEVERGARHPRGRTDWPVVGIFAQRAKWRPNRVGASLCRVLAVEGLTVRVEGLDAIDGTPVIDVKPYVREFGPRGEVRQPAWATELMSRYY